MKKWFYNIDNRSSEDKIYNGIIRHLLPKVGKFVSTLIASASSSISNTHIRGMLKQLPNVRHVDLSYTNVSAEAVIGLAKFGALKNLEELNLSGCRYISDLVSILRNSFSSSLTVEQNKLERLSLPRFLRLV